MINKQKRTTISADYDFAKKRKLRILPQYKRVFLKIKTWDSLLDRILKFTLDILKIICLVSNTSLVKGSIISKQQVISANVKAPKN